MTRCECAGVSFTQIAKYVQASGRSLEAVMDDTGIGRMCTGCIPDLRAFAAQYRPSPD